MRETSRAADKKLQVNNNQDASVYGAMVGLAQDFAMRYPLVNGHGNWGSVDGDPAAAMRYTEAKLTPVGELMMADINKNTVDMITNYDESEMEASVLPGLFPSLLANGTSGIAVGVACSFVPHKVSDVYKALDKMLENAETDLDTPIEELIDIIQAPDFPTGGTIINLADVHRAYRGERISVKIRGKYHIEHEKNKDIIIFTEIPYKVNKAHLVTNIHTQITMGLYPDVDRIADESDRSGMRIAIYLKRGADSTITLNKLFKKSALQSSISMNHVALVDGRPRTNLTLKDMLEAFLGHAVSIVQRRTQYDYDKELKRAHILEGLMKAVPMMDDVYYSIRKSKNKPGAIKAVSDLVELDEDQAAAVVEQHLYALTEEDIQRLSDDRDASLNKVEHYHQVLTDEVALIRETRDSLSDVAKRFAKEERLTDIALDIDATVDDRDLIKEENIVVYFTHNGQVKAVPVSDCSSQGRAGKGNTLKTKEDDFVEHILTLSNKDNLVFITNEGRAYVLPAYKLPIQNKNTVAKYLNNYVQFEDGEVLKDVLAVKPDDKEHSLFFITENGIGKRIAIDSLPTRNAGTRVITFKDDGDQVVDCIIVDDNSEVLVITAAGYGLRTSLNNIRVMGKTASGVKVMKFKDPNDYIVAALRASDDDAALIVSGNGLAKRLKMSDVPSKKGRGGVGVTCYKMTSKTGSVKAAVNISEDNTIFVVTTQGKVIRVPASQIRTTGRTAAGVKLIRLDKDDCISSVSSAPAQEDPVETGDSDE